LQVTRVMSDLLILQLCYPSSAERCRNLATNTAVLTKRVEAHDGAPPWQCISLAGPALRPRVLAQFADSLKAFNFEVRLVDVASASRSQNSVHACLLPLTRTAVASVRKSKWFAPRRTLVYGIGDWRAAAQFRDLGINALIEKPSDLNFRTALSMTQSVIGRGIGRQARVPIVTRVRIQTGGLQIIGLTRNIGPGGMALTLARSVSLPDVVEVTFALPGGHELSLSASPRWYSGVLVGLCHHPSGNSKLLKKWIDQYSRLGTMGK
jgi:PilZ domain